MSNADCVYMIREPKVLRSEISRDISLDFTVCTLTEEGAPRAERLNDWFMVMDAFKYHPVVVALQQLNVPDYSNLSLMTASALISQCSREYENKAMILVSVPKSILNTWKAGGEYIEDERDFLGLCCLLSGGFKDVNCVIGSYGISTVHMHTSSEILRKSGLSRDLNEAMGVNAF